ncbi:MAG: cytochrome c-type biogenesis protein CcmH [Hyphomonadaceae bacterium]|nr:MAG: cytochrome c-type bioproteinis protein CcmH [Caulobacteraceae bacterium]MBT9446552.1 cytochrome c-type biogenesis protein CcmH [Hyphomonadaceae bacterium]
MIRALASLAFLAATGAPAALDPQAEARAQALDGEIRCVVCENEPISQSTASIAADMRALVRERIAAGDTDAQIRAFFADRYGDFVLLRPRASSLTWPLWAAPLLLLLLGGLAAAPLLRRRASGAGEADPAPDPEDDR